VYELSDLFGVHRNTVSVHLKRQGIEMRHASLRTPQREVATQLRVGGLSLVEIGRRLGVTLQSQHDR